MTLALLLFITINEWHYIIDFLVRLKMNETNTIDKFPGFYFRKYQAVQNYTTIFIILPKIYLYIQGHITKRICKL